MHACMHTYMFLFTYSVCVCVRVWSESPAGLTAQPLAHLFLILDLVLGDWSFTTRILIDLLLRDLRAVA